MSVPDTLFTLQVYFALSSAAAPSITIELSLVTEYLTPRVISDPSFVQVTDGVGTPLTGHLMVIVVFEAAVTLSPMFIITGLPSPRGISCPDSGTSITGLKGSAKSWMACY